MTRRKQGNVVQLADRQPSADVYLAIEPDLYDLLRAIELASLAYDQTDEKHLPIAFKYVEERAAAVREALAGAGQDER